MNDRELLEMAAKAAGETGKIVKRHCGGGSVYAIERHDGTFWMPLYDDGDAFRLMVDLNLDLTFDIIEGDVFVCETFGDYWSECLGDNPRAAARRAIVRAAADIGRDCNVRL